MGLISHTSFKFPMKSPLPKNNFPTKSHVDLKGNLIGGVDYNKQTLT